MSFIELWNTSDAKKLQLNIEHTEAVYFDGENTSVTTIGEHLKFPGEYAPLYGFRHLIDRIVRLILRKKN
jgi:hypothetical protein